MHRVTLWAGRIKPSGPEGGADQPAGFGRRAMVGLGYAIPGIAALAVLSSVFGWWPFVIAGISDGAVYALAALGLVLTYKTSGIFNFAVGAQAAASAYVFYSLWDVAHLPWPVAALLVVVLVGLGGSLVLERLGYWLADVPPVMKVVATIGLLVFLQSLLTVAYGTQTIELNSFLPTKGLEIGGAYVTGADVITAAIGLAATVVLYLFFKTRRLGIAMQAVVEDSSLLSLKATNPVTVRRASWAIGSSFIAVSGMLLAPALGINVDTMLLVYVAAFGAAAVGGFSSLPLTFIAAIAIGIAMNITYYELGSSSHLFVANLYEQIPFLVLVAALVLLPRAKLLDRSSSRTRRLPPVRPFLPSAAIVMTVAIVGAAAALPYLVPAYYVGQWTTGVAFAVIFGSLSLLLWRSGQISLCQMAFAAVGATTFARLLSVGIPWFLALFLAAAITVPVGALVAIPSFRLSGIYLAVATFAFGLLFQNLIYNTFLMFGSSLGLSLNRPSIALSDKSYYYVVLIVAALCALLLWAVTRSRLGRLLRALSDSPPGLAAHGADTRVLRLYVFCISAFVAAIGGALLAGESGSISGISGGTYGYFNSIVLVAILACCGRRVILSPLLAAVAFSVLKIYPFFTDIVPIPYQGMLFGASAIWVSIQPNFRRPKVPRMLRSKRSQDSTGNSNPSQAVAA